MNILNALGEISAGGIRNLARNLFAGFYDRGISANKALAELQSQGLGYRRQDFLADFREGKGEFDQATRIKYVNPLNTPSEGILEPKYHGVPDKFSMVFRYEGVNKDTGEDITGYMFYHRNSLLRRADMENDAFDFLASQADKYPYTISSVQIMEGYINPVRVGDVS